MRLPDLIIKYRDPSIVLGAIICFVEFLAMGNEPSQEYASMVGVLHLLASFLLLVTLILYITLWRMGWVLFLRVTFAIFIVFMMVYSFRLGISILL